MEKQAIINALQAFINQRSGIEFCNYGDVSAFRSEQRKIQRDGKEARELLHAIEWRDSITAEDMLKAAESAYSGRLTIRQRDDGKVAIDYCTGQYFPTEYRAAVAAVCASALWDYARANMPEPDGKIRKITGHGQFAREYEKDSYNGKSAGDYLRDNFRREYGRAIQSRWFN
jgi:hypothetical protein